MWKEEIKLVWEDQPCGNGGREGGRVGGKEAWRNG